MGGEKCAKMQEKSYFLRFCLETVREKWVILWIIRVSKLYEPGPAQMVPGGERMWTGSLSVQSVMSA